MPKTYELDDDVIERLAELSEPLEDVNAVLRRTLGTSGAPTKPAPRGRRASPGSILAEREYELPILRALLEMGGSGQALEVTDRVGELLDGKLKPRDHEELESGDIRWRNRTAFTRHTLKKRGLLKADSPRGVWELTKKGERAAETGNPRPGG